MGWRAALLFGLFGIATSLWSAEVQRHGFVFEAWVRETFFDGYRPARYTQQWDIPAAANRAHGGVPVNPKATKHGTPVDLGDALRQFDINEPFLLVIGYWQPDNGGRHFVKTIAPRVEPDVWRKLWEPITRADLERLVAVIRDPTLTPAQARLAALRIKRAPPFSQAIMQVNPKIDSKTQRRLQCSLRFADVFAYLAPDVTAAPERTPQLWGVEVPDCFEPAPLATR
jgi:hypothetical protein